MRRQAEHSPEPNDAADVNFDELATRFGVAAVHPARVRSARIANFMMAGIGYGIAALFWNVDDLPVERRQLAAIVIAAGSTVLALIAAMAPARVVTAFAAWIDEGPIESVLSHDRTLGLPTGRAAAELVAVALIVVAINLAFWALDVGRIAWCIGLLIPTMAWAWSLMYRQKFRGARNYESLIRSAVLARGYGEEDKVQVAKFLKASFLRDDTVLELESLWAIWRDEAVITWGRYSTGGSTLSSGLYCMIGFAHPVAPLQLGELLARMGPVHFDDRSKTIFGTFRLGEARELRDLDGLQWQWGGKTLVGRFDQGMLASKREAAGDGGAEVERLVVGWESLASWLGTAPTAGD